MPPKAKPKASAASAEDDESWENFQKIYSKSLKQLGIAQLPDAVKIFEQVSEGEGFKGAWNFTSPIEKLGFQVLMRSLRESRYTKIRAIRLWRCGEKGDEPVRSVCDYLESPGGTNVEDLQITGNNMTELGCEFLARALGWKERQNFGEIIKLPPVSYLRLDYNNFGAKGMHNLAQGLAQNNQLRALSLQYCGIGPEGGEALKHILLFVESALEQLFLKGNELRDMGIISVLRGLKKNPKMKVLDVSNNKFSELPEIIDSFLELFQNSTNIEIYRLNGNEITDTGAQKLIHGLIGMSHIKEVMIPERCSQSTFQALDQALGHGKKKGKKKKS